MPDRRIASMRRRKPVRRQEERRIPLVLALQRRDRGSKGSADVPDARRTDGQARRVRILGPLSRLASFAPRMDLALFARPPQHAFARPDQDVGRGRIAALVETPPAAPATAGERLLERSRLARRRTHTPRTPAGPYARTQAEGSTPGRRDRTTNCRRSAPATGGSAPASPRCAGRSHPNLSGVNSDIRRGSVCIS